MSSTTAGHGTHNSHHAEVDLLHGVVARFADADSLLAAANKAREAGYKHMDAYSPFPVHGLSDAIGFKDSKVPWAIFFAGCGGFMAGLGLQYYTAVIDYPMNVGGRPNFSWQSFVPVTYELTILVAGLTAVFGMLAFNGLPKPYHPIFNTKDFDRASQDGFFLCLENHADFDEKEAEKFLKGLKAMDVAPVYADEEGGY